MGARRWVPFLLTTSRIPLSALLYSWLSREMLEQALGALVVAQATDWADGELARRWRLGSRAGEILEHLVDSLMMLLVGLGLVQAAILPAWLYVAGVLYAALTWITPRALRRFTPLDFVLSLRTILYGVSLVVIPFLLFRRIAAERPMWGIWILIGLILWGILSLYWKRGRIAFYLREFWHRFTPSHADSHAE
ncbi:MAG: hypothetical protein KatS3mg115_0108 [Candidatus Poribacteria bacterium]|nr:MAG: hypothetical protein KatS3mg115_0108 [Candidatus Poribacteria bacterium]